MAFALAIFPYLSELFGTARSRQGRAGFARRSEPLTARTVPESGVQGKGGRGLRGAPGGDPGAAPLRRTARSWCAASGNWRLPPAFWDSHRTYLVARLRQGWLTQRRFGHCSSSMASPPLWFHLDRRLLTRAPFQTPPVLQQLHPPIPSDADADLRPEAAPPPSRSVETGCRT